MIMHLVGHYGYTGIFFALVLGIIGLPIPDEGLMAVAGYLVSEGKLQYSATVLVAFFGSISGMSLSYFIGHQFGWPLLEKYGSKVRITPEKLRKVSQWFGRFGKLSVTFGYFFPGIRQVIAYSAGISKWPFRTFMLYSFPGGLVWVLTFITFGIFLEEKWRYISTSLANHLWLFFVALACGLAGWRFFAHLGVRRGSRGR